MILNKTQPMDLQQIKEFLDETIIYWRTKRDNKFNTSQETLIASCYIDAYQSVRVNLFGEKLKSSNDDLIKNKTSETESK